MSSRHNRAAHILVMEPTRNKHVGKPGNGGQFAPSTKTEGHVSLMAESMQTSEPIKRLPLSSSHRMVEEIVHNLGTGMLTADTPYQRGHVWDQGQRRNLIRSFLSGIPVPAIIINDRSYWPGITAEEPWDALIDGKQRVESARQWLAGELTVPASWFRPELIESTVNTDDGPYVGYDGLGEVGRRLFRNEATFPVVTARMKSVEAEAALYVQVNTSGADQSDEDIENARRVAAGR